MPPVDAAELLKEDEQRAAMGLPPRFAQPIPVYISPTTHGTWEALPSGILLWRLRIHSPGAVSINLGFTRYLMPLGGRLFLYTPDYRRVVGPFTERDNEAHGQLWTPILPGEEIIIEVSLPAAVVSQLALELTSVNHGYREFSRPRADKSGACNVDVVCPEGDDWRDEIRSVAVYSTGGSLLCSGFLLNNTAQDLRPYFLTANHCGIHAGNAPSMVVYWNYENSTCRAPGSPESGQPGDGTLDQFNTGAIFRAGYAPSDFTLVELDDPVDPAFNVHWAGWDRTDGDPTSAVAIHHPDTDEKRISFEYDPTTTTSYLQASSPGDGTHIRVTDWDLGTTEPGSSGSPLFNQDHRVVGQLHGGYAACGNDLSDWYGRLSVSWTGGGTASTRLLDWLDPIGSGVMVLDGKDQDPDFALEVTPAHLDICIPEDAIYEVSLDSIMGFTDPVTLTVGGNPEGTSANFDPNPVTPPGTSALTITNTALATPGSYSMDITGISGASIHSRTVTLNLLDDVPGSVTLIAPADGATDELLAPTFEWNAAPHATAYFLEVATDTGFNATVYSATVTGTSHTPTAYLARNTTHHWRVTPQGACGPGSPSAAFSFTTANLICSRPNATIPDNRPSGISDTVATSDTGAVGDLDVFIRATHTWVGDLIFTLEHIDTGTKTTLIDRPGCSGDDIEATLDDEADSPVEDACAASVPTIFGSFTPSEPLSRFDGERFSGTWSLTVSDNAYQYIGTLVEWCLLRTTQPPQLRVSKIVNQAMPAPGQVITYTIVVTNHIAGDATGATISDTLPTGLAFVGPATLDPPQPGATLAQDTSDLPELASGVTVTAGERITLTFPVAVNIGLTVGTVITNVATVTCGEIITPQMGSATVTVSGHLYLPLALRSFPPSSLVLFSSH